MISFIIIIIIILSVFSLYIFYVKYFVLNYENYIYDQKHKYHFECNKTWQRFDDKKKKKQS